MKIFYDYQMLIEQKYGGVTRYHRELIKELEKTKNVEVEIHCFMNKNAYFSDYFDRKECDIPHSTLVSKPINKFLSLYKWGKGCDIIHPTFYDPYILKRKDAPIVLTVHDMIHELFPELIGHNDSLVHNKAKMIHGADHLIAISESTKRDILKVYPEVPEDKISVVYHGCNNKREYTEAVLGLNKDKEIGRYVLYVGGRSGYKNFERFLRAIIPTLKRDNELKVVCAGGGAFSKDELELIKSVESQVIQSDVNDENLQRLYSNAICFVFPSLYEGFGIPTLEAFANCCPAIISNTSSMPEVGGDAAIYFDPLNIDDINDKVENVIYDERKQKQMILQGLERMSNFTWSNTAKGTISVYKKVLGN